MQTTLYYRLHYGDPPTVPLICGNFHSLFWDPFFQGSGLGFGVVAFFCLRVWVAASLGCSVFPLGIPGSLRVFSGFCFVLPFRVVGSRVSGVLASYSDLENFLANAYRICQALQYFKQHLT